MNSFSERDHVDRNFPSPAEAPEPAGLRTPRLLGSLHATPGFVMGNRAFMRAWAARRAAKTAASVEPDAPLGLRSPARKPAR